MTEQRAHADGSAGDVDYGAIGGGYSSYRRADPRIAAAILDALGDAETILNVGAGAGSYEPTDRIVTAVEPSASMRAQRPAGRPAIDAVAAALPFDDNSFDASMATFSVHQWPDAAAGLRELRRVTRGPVVIMSADPARVPLFWLNDYVPEILGTEAKRYPALHSIAGAFAGGEIRPVPIPFDCTDGFNEAYFGRPELLLDPGARKANSAWSFRGPEVDARFALDLAADLESGAWDEKYGELRTLPEWDGSLRLVIGRR